MFKFIFKSLTTIVIGIILGWYMANTQLPMKLKKELIIPKIKTIKVIFNSNEFKNK